MIVSGLPRATRGYSANLRERASLGDPRFAGEAGFTLLEMITAGGISIIIATALMSLFNFASRSSLASASRTSLSSYRANLPQSWPGPRPGRTRSTIPRTRSSFRLPFHPRAMPGDGPGLPDPGHRHASARGLRPRHPGADGSGQACNGYPARAARTRLALSWKPLCQPAALNGCDPPVIEVDATYPSSRFSSYQYDVPHLTFSLVEAVTGRLRSRSSRDPPA